MRPDDRTALLHCRSLAPILSAELRRPGGIISDDERRPSPFYSPNRPPPAPRQPKPGEKVWRLERNGHVQSCELRNDSNAGAGWDVMILKDGEPLFSRRCADESGARYIAESFRQDLIRTEWIATES
jgi:hypothetical protein